MESNDGFRQLLEFIFCRKVTISDRKVSRCSIPPCFMREDFSKKLGDVLHIKKMISFYHFRKCFGKDALKLLSSHEDAICECYVMGIIIACLCEYETNQKVFEKFISVCAIAMFMSEKTLSMTGLDFRDLNPDIIMVFYKSMTQSPFHKARDFKKFAEFIRDHKILKWNCDKIDHASSDGASSVFLKQLHQKIREEVNRYPPLPGEVKSAIESTAKSMAEKVLSKTSVELANLPSKAVLFGKLGASRKMDKATNKEKQTKRKGEAKTALKNATSHVNSSSISDSKPNCSAVQQEDIEWHESIVQAVIRHNHSNISHHDDAQNPKLVEAEEILKHLKTSIKFFMEVLDECNQE